MYNQISKMGNDRLTKRVFNYDLECNGQWTNNLRAFCETIGCECELDNRTHINVKRAKAMLLTDYHSCLYVESQKSVKLHNLVKIRDNFDTGEHLTAHLSKQKQSLIS